MFSLLNNGSVWALNLEFVTARIAFFCNLWIVELLNHQDKTPKCKCGDTRLLYIVFKTSLGRKCFSLWRTPTVLPIFDAIFPTWDDHVMVSLNVKPRKLNSLIRSMLFFQFLYLKKYRPFCNQKYEKSYTLFYQNWEKAYSLSTTNRY